MATINQNFLKLQNNYLFSSIAKKVNNYKAILHCNSRVGMNNLRIDSKNQTTNNIYNSKLNNRSHKH